MSFGFGVGDLVQLGQLAWTVYKACKEAPEGFGKIAHDVLSVQAVLKEVEESISGHDLTQSQEAGLKTVSEGCYSVLKDLETLVHNYESLGTQSKRTWDRMEWGLQDVADLRSRLTSSTVLLTAFLSTSQITVEKKLNRFLTEFKHGKHEGSVVTNHTVESLTVDEKETWRAIRKELQAIGITVAAFDANKGFILRWFQAAMQAGAFEEQSHIQDTIIEEMGVLPDISESLKEPLIGALPVDTSSYTVAEEAGIVAYGAVRRSPTQEAPKSAFPAVLRKKRFPRVASLLFKPKDIVQEKPKDIVQGTQEGDWDAVLLALRRGSSVNLRSDDYDTLLHSGYEWR